MLRGFLFWHCAPWIASSAYPERVGVPVVPSDQEARVSDGRTEGITGKTVQAMIKEEECGLLTSF